MNQIEELLQAIRSLESQRSTLGDQVVDTALGPLEEKLVKLEQDLQPINQRRLVSVLFLDIYNSTTLSQGLEPEEVLEIIGGTLKRLSTLINSHGGVVTQVMGDGFMAVFGLIRTHEDDARQAVRAGLALLAEAMVCAEELEKHYKIRGFNVRVGINTGRVVAGRFTEMESTVMGLTVTLAARMEQTAQPGTLSVSQYTYQHIRGAFEVELLSPVEAKGFSQPVTVYRVLSARPKTFRTFTRGVEDIETTLISRQAELQQLKSAIMHAFREQRTQLFTITGEAGIGKSRLLYEFDRWIAKSDKRVIAFKARGAQQMAAMPFGLLRELISYHLNILTTDPAELIRQKIEDAISTNLDESIEMKAHFIGSLLGFDFSNSPEHHLIENDPKQLSERAQLYLMQYIHALASKNNTIIMLDDLHWADLPSLNFITRLCTEHPDLPLFIICLTRPIVDENFPEWARGIKIKEKLTLADKVTSERNSLTLGPLSQQACIELMGQILQANNILPQAVQEKILTSANGNPFYLEEYIQALIHTNAIRKRENEKGWVVDPEKLGKIDLPSTLIALLEARLDNLHSNQKALVQQASVIGQVFWHSALQALRKQKPFDEKELVALTEHGFIFPQEGSTFEGTTEFRFHHGLLRDVAYQGIIKSDRKYYHGQAAAWFIKETEDLGREGEYAAIIAEHYELADEMDLASDWYTRSGIMAHNQGAPAQALSFFDRALSLFPQGDYTAGDISNKLRCWNALAGRDEVLGILGETERRKADDNALVLLANSIGDEKLIAEAFYRKGFSLAESGQYLQANKAYEEGLSAARHIKDQRCEALLLGVKVACEVRLGDLTSAYQTTIDALACAEKLGDDQVMARTLNNISTFYTETGDLDRAVEALNRQMEINHRTGNIDGEVVGLSNLGYIYILSGMPEEGVRHLELCIEKAQSIGHRSFSAYGGLNLALAFLRSGDPSQALTVLDRYIPELKMMNDVFGYSTGETYAAMAMEQKGSIAEALAGYEHSASTFIEIGIQGSAKDAEGGIIRCLLRMNEVEAAKVYSTKLLKYLMRKSGAGMEFPILGYVTCMNAFTTSGMVSLAKTSLDEGYQELMRRAEKISSPKWRQSFLEGVPENHTILELWQKNSGRKKEEQ